MLEGETDDDGGVEACPIRNVLSRFGDKWSMLVLYQLHVSETGIEPDRISILNFSGPNHTIPMEAVREGKSLRSRRYRNRRLGEFLKELDLTEGRATGIPTIQDELKANGSTKATIETDEERTYFLIDIPCHPEFMKETLSVEQIGVKGGVKGGVKELSNIQEVIVKDMLFDPSITTSKMAQKTDIKFRTLQRHIKGIV